MKRLPLITVCLLFILVGISFAQIYYEQTDAGRIEEMFGDKIYVQGNMGLHVFEMISPCSWCEPGSRVTIRFDSFTKASVGPDPNILRTAPIRAFIIKDGREENQ